MYPTFSSSQKSQQPTGVTAGFTFGGLPFPLFAPGAGVGADAGAAAKEGLAFFGGCQRGLPVPPELFGFGGGAKGSLGFGGRPRGPLFFGLYKERSERK
ncbi:hypothetical protein SLEP1_g41955 [Rubroshorea leprosula]|uniref:Uncharacterized protein n=1 Tax=Rubroshorea leprosula TaxID=152421 RepID=A0AAV5L8M4_9ROSI|nr:hypothetical protein SLEP1_g41955 [Rubroshorea leprosula]